MDFALSDPSRSDVVVLSIGVVVFTAITALIVWATWRREGNRAKQFAQSRWALPFGFAAVTALALLVFESTPMVVSLLNLAALPLGWLALTVASTVSEQRSRQLSSEVQTGLRLSERSILVHYRVVGAAWFVGAALWFVFAAAVVGPVMDHWWRGAGRTTPEYWAVLYLVLLVGVPGLLVVGGVVHMSVRWRRDRIAHDRGHAADRAQLGIESRPRETSVAARPGPQDTAAGRVAVVVTPAVIGAGLFGYAWARGFAESAVAACACLVVGVVVSVLFAWAHVLSDRGRSQRALSVLTAGLFAAAGLAAAASLVIS